MGRLHFYMLEHMLRNGMNETAEVFCREADIREPPSWLNLPDGFLSNLWGEFWDSHTWEHDRGNETTEEESYSQPEAQAQSQDEAVTVAAHGYVHARAQPQMHVQSWAFANSDNVIHQHIQPYNYNVIIVSPTSLAVEQHNVVRHYVSLDVRQSRAFSDPSSNLG
uniref:uncharacterized protein LOC122592244 n=1 Tax=Erigeron canadensis TaxID=72917 RepID=UPI001CB99833|nr:uncharacterized protein LOC122592244 [Erigeron canadensis]